LIKLIDNIIYNPFPSNTVNDFNILNYKREVIGEFLDDQFASKEQYQIVIMAAGRGSRMDLKYPKCFYNLKYPDGQRTVISNLLRTIAKSTLNITYINIVINSKDEDHFRGLLHDNKKIKLLTLNSNQIEGTARCLDAIRNDLIANDNILLLWGDLALIPTEYIYFAAILHEKFHPSITMPTRYKKNPYVAFIRNNQGEFTDVFHSNEGRPYQGWAEQDSLLFIINYSVLSLLSQYLKDDTNKQSKDIDFVSFIPYCSTLKTEHVIGLPICEENYVSGLNNVNKANIINDYLKQYSNIEYKNIFLNNNYV